MSPLPFILAAVSLRRIDQKTGVAEDVHADDHVVSHVLPIGDGDRDIEFPAGDHDAGIDDVSFFRLVRRGRPNADAVEHGPETRTRRQIRVKAGPSRARVNPRQHADIALAAAQVTSSTTPMVGLSCRCRRSETTGRTANSLRLGR